MDSTLACLAAWMPRQRWYAAKGRPPSLRLISWWDLAPVAAEDAGARIRTYLVADEGAFPAVLYQLPVVSRATETVDAAPDHIIGSPEPGTTFIDGPFDPAYARALIRLVTLGGTGGGPRTVATGHPAPDAPPSDAPDAAYPPIVLGRDLAEQIGAQVGDSILVTSPQGELTPLGLAPKYQRFHLAGIFHSGFYQYDTAMAFMRLTDAQRLFSEPDLLSVISFKVDNLYRAPEIAKTIEAAAGKGYMSTNWMEQNRELFRALKLEQIVTFIVIALIVIVAALNILIALTMMVMEKTRDIAVLMSFGV